MIEKMVSGLPDYTKYITSQVTIQESDRPFGTKAEVVDKKMAYATGGEGAVTLTLKAEVGKYIGLLLLVGTTDGAGSLLLINSWWLDGSVKLLEKVNCEANAPIVLVFPCWIPDQDPSDGVNNNLTIQLNGSCGERNTLMAIYFEEDA